MLRETYDDIKAKLAHLSPESKTVLNNAALFDATESKFKKGLPHPIDSLSDNARHRFLTELGKLGLGNVQNTKNVYADMRKGGIGYKTPVYNVNQHPVMGFHFDTAGELVGTAKIYAPAAAKPSTPKR